MSKAAAQKNPSTQGGAETIASAEVSLHRNVLATREKHELVDLGISFYDYETTIQWSYNADAWFHAASTMKLAVLLGVFRQVHLGELTVDAPVHVRNRFTSIVNGEPYMLELSRDADPDVYGQLGKTLSVHQLAYQMITTSSNLATNLLVEIVGVETIQRALDELEIDGVKVLRGVEDQAAFDAGLNNETTASGSYSTATGSETIAGAFYSTAMGRKAQATHMGSFVWADSQGTPFASTADDQFSIRAANGVRIYNPVPGAELLVLETERASAHYRPTRRLAARADGTWTATRP